MRRFFYVVPSTKRMGMRSIDSSSCCCDLRQHPRGTTLGSFLALCQRVRRFSCVGMPIRAGTVPVQQLEGTYADDRVVA